MELTDVLIADSGPWASKQAEKIRNAGLVPIVVTNPQKAAELLNTSAFYFAFIADDMADVLKLAQVADSKGVYLAITYFPSIRPEIQEKLSNYTEYFIEKDKFINIEALMKEAREEGKE